MLKLKNQKITTIRFLITGIKTKTTHTFPCCIQGRQRDFKLLNFRNKFMISKINLKREKT